MSAVLNSAPLHFEDCSARPRCGCKGPGAESWLRTQGYRIPAAPNSAAIEQGALVARLASSEFLIEALDAANDRVGASRLHLQQRAQPRDVYAVVRQDRVTTISGAGLPALLRQICSVDCAPLLAPAASERASGEHDGPVLLTSMMGVGVLAWPRCLENGPAVSVWCEPSYGHYFWNTLLEVGREAGNVSLGSDR
jgi:sarcosine oxidase, subunit gamma